MGNSKSQVKGKTFDDLVSESRDAWRKLLQKVEAAAAAKNVLGGVRQKNDGFNEETLSFHHPDMVI